jgi:hypothetical protein
MNYSDKQDWLPAMFKENKEFLARTGLLIEGDIEFLAEKVTDFNSTVYFSGK